MNLVPRASRLSSFSTADVAQAEASRSLRLVERHSTGPEPLDLPREVIPQLFVEIRFESLAPQQRSQPVAEAYTHGRPRFNQAVRRMASSAVEKRSHASCSDASCRLPAAVRA